jgi:hypothetical protein
MIVVFLLFALLGVKQFQGFMYQRCRTAEGLWVAGEHEDILCSMDPNKGYQCPDNLTCMVPKQIADDQVHR